MALGLRITGRAAAEIARADAWWRENRLAVPLAVREDLKGAFELLMRQPGVGVKVGNTGSCWLLLAEGLVFHLDLILSLTTNESAKQMGLANRLH